MQTALTIILTSLALSLLAKIFPTAKRIDNIPIYDSKIHGTFRKEDTIGAVLLIVVIPLLGYFLSSVILKIERFFQQPKVESNLLIDNFRYNHEMSSHVFYICFTLAIFCWYNYSVAEYYLKERYDDYIAYSTAKSMGINVEKAMRYIAIFFLTMGLIIGLLGDDMGYKIYSNKIEWNSFFSYSSTKTYRIDDIQRLNIKYFSKKNMSSNGAKLFFNDNEYISIDPDSTILNYLSKSCKIKIDTTYINP